MSVLVAAGPSSDMVEARSGFFKTGLDAVLGLSETGTSPESVNLSEAPLSVFY